MALGIYDVIQGTITTPKTLLLRKKHGKITFAVNKLANKSMVREAVEKIWDVKVRDVRIVNVRGKVKVIKRRSYKKPDLKKALVTLKPGYKIDLPEQYESMGVSESETAPKGGE